MLSVTYCPHIGVSVQTPSGEMVARAILINCSVDLPARAFLINMKQWKGINGCEHEGVTVGDDHLNPEKAAQFRNIIPHNAEHAIRTRTTVSKQVKQKFFAF